MSLRSYDSLKNLKNSCSWHLVPYKSTSKAQNVSHKSFSHLQAPSLLTGPSKPFQPTLRFLPIITQLSIGKFPANKSCTIYQTTLYKLHKVERKKSHSTPKTRNSSILTQKHNLFVFEPTLIFPKKWIFNERSKQRKNYCRNLSIFLLFVAPARTRKDFLACIMHEN